MSVVDDLLAQLHQEEVQAAGPGEVDKPSPASTRGTTEGSDADGRRQKSNRLVVELVETYPPWPTSWDPLNPWPTWDAWRAEVARLGIEKDAAAGAPTTPYVPDTDEIVQEHARTWEWLRVLDGEGVEWVNVPPFEVEDLPQPVTVLERERRRVYPEPKPVEKLAAVDVLPKACKTRSLMTEEQVEFALGLLADGQTVLQVSGRYWQEWGFASRKSCEFSLRRRRGAIANQQASRERVAA